MGKRWLAQVIGTVTERWVGSDPVRQKRKEDSNPAVGKETELGDWLSEGRGGGELEVMVQLEMKA